MMVVIIANSTNKFIQNGSSEQPVNSQNRCKQIYLMDIPTQFTRIFIVYIVICLGRISEDFVPGIMVYLPFG